MTKFEKSNTITRHIFEAIKGISQEEIKVLDVSEITPLADIFVIVTAQNTRAVAGLTDEIEKKLKEKDHEVIGKEGYNAGRWVLLDFNGVIVHIFHKEEAEFYNLDQLWSDAKVLDLDIK